MYTVQPTWSKSKPRKGKRETFNSLASAMEDADNCMTAAEAVNVRITGPGFAVRLKRKTQWPD